MMMKILVAHNFYKQPGGEDQCVAAEIALLEARGHEVIPYYLHNDAIDNMSGFQIASRTTWSRAAYGELRRLIRKHRPAVAHFHNTFPLMSPAGYYAARAEKVGVVQSLHNFRLLCPNALFFRAGRVCEDCLGRSIPWPGVVHKCYRDSRAASATVAAMLATHRARGTWREAVDVYIALTKFGRKKFIQGGLPGNKIVVKPHFVHPDPGVGSGLGEYALFVGRLSPEKGIATLLETWTRLSSQIPLKIVGDGPLGSMVEATAAKRPEIQWLKRQPLEVVYQLAGAARFVVVPSQCYETFGRVIIESFAKGTPVLVSNFGAMAELVDHGRTGLRFEPGNAADLAAKVDRFLEDSQERERMRWAARQEYERKYNAQANYQALIAIYERAVRAGRRKTLPETVC